MKTNFIQGMVALEGIGQFLNKILDRGLKIIDYKIIENPKAIGWAHIVVEVEAREK